MKRATWSVLVAWSVGGAALSTACKEPMHPPADEAESTSQREKAAEPAAPSKNNAPSAQATKPNDNAAAVSSTQSSDGKREVTSDGYDVIRAKKEGSADVAVQAPPGWQLAKQPPDGPDPHAGKFELADALKDLPGQGKLGATIRTSLGTFDCQLFEDKAPKTVANFVGLARGLRKFWSPKDHAWVARPYYDGTVFHRVIPEFMIQGGDWAGDGSGNMYFTIPDELHPTLKHDRGGLLCMANRGPNTNEAQFFITEAAAPHLDSSYSIFGECSQVDLVKKIARVPQSGPPNNRPLTPVVIEKISIARKGAGAAAAKPAAETKPAAAPVPEGKAVQVAPPKPAAQ
ncbi:MAG: peptidylprolyl isomerase [Polyangiales bacterium]